MHDAVKTPVLVSLPDPPPYDGEAPPGVPDEASLERRAGGYFVRSEKFCEAVAPPCVTYTVYFASPSLIDGLLVARL